MSSCACCANPTLIFSCSGSSDVGELADRSCRRMTKENIGKMFCLAGIGGKVSGMIQSTMSAEAILVVDGCPLNCAQKTLQEAGFEDFAHIQIADLGFKKGNCPVNDDTIAQVVDAGRQALCKVKGCC